MSEDQDDKGRTTMTRCGDLFGSGSNLIATDFDGVHALQVTKSDLPQEPGGGGIDLQLSVSWHALGKMGGAAHDTLDLLVAHLREGHGGMNKDSTPKRLLAA